MLDYRGQRVLILAPHADDETIGCGGVIQKYLQAKSPVRVLVGSFNLAEYEKYKSDKECYEPYSGATRLLELQQAYEILGIQDYHFLYLDKFEPIRYHSYLETIPRIELVAKIEQHLQEFRPTTLFIPSKTKHQDHEALHLAALTAARPYFWNGSIVVYETDGEFSFQPNLFVSLSAEEVGRKAQALTAFQTQLGPNGHPVNADFLLVKAQFRGQNIYSSYAEAFEIARLHA